MNYFFRFGMSEDTWKDIKQDLSVIQLILRQFGFSRIYGHYISDCSGLLPIDAVLIPLSSFHLK